MIDNITLIDSNTIGIWYFSTWEWFDIGAIYDTDMNFKGYYCDICTPMKRVSNGFEITDFVLDVWVFPNGQYQILDQDEYHNAVMKKWLTQDQQIIVETELHRLIEQIEASTFPTLLIKNLLNLPNNIDEILDYLKRCK